MNFNWRHYFNFGFISELIIFSLTQLLGLWVAFNFIVKSTPIATGQPVANFPAWEFLVALFSATIILWLILKFVKNNWVINLIFSLGIFQGIWLFAYSFMDWGNALIFLGFWVVFYFFYANIIIHDLALIMALSAIGVYFGFNFQPKTMIIILIILAIYDFIAVYKTQHMVTMFKKLQEQKVNLAIIIPAKLRDFLMKLNYVKTDNQFMFLGTGDLVIPLIFTISCLHTNLRTALFALAGSILGFIFLYTLFISQKERNPMPGLPPLVLGCLLGYLVSFIL